MFEFRNGRAYDIDSGTAIETSRESECEYLAASNDTETYCILIL